MTHLIHEGEEIVRRYCDRCKMYEGKVDFCSFKAIYVSGLGISANVERRKNDIDLCRECAKESIKGAFNIRRPHKIKNTGCCLACKKADPECEVDQGIFSRDHYFKFTHICLDCIAKLHDYALATMSDEAKERAAHLHKPTREQWKADGDRRDKEAEERLKRREDQRKRDEEIITHTFGVGGGWGFTAGMNDIKVAAWQLGLECDTITQRDLFGKQMMFRVKGKRRNVELLLSAVRRSL